MSETDWSGVCKHGWYANQCNLCKMEAENKQLRDKLQRVLDWLRHEANSPGGLASELEPLTIADQS